VIVYSCLTSGYDQFPVVPAPEPGVRYLLFSDSDDDAPAPWQVVPLRDAGLSPRRLSRAPKIRPYCFLPPHSVSVYIDANINLHERAALRPVAEAALERADIAVPRHVKRKWEMRKHSHTCTYAEAKVCAELSLDRRERIDAQMQRYRETGFPEEFGLLENCFIIRRNNDAARALNEMWWSEYLAGSERDQLSLMFCLWSLGIPWHELSINARNNHFYTQRLHLKSRRAA